MFYLKSVKSNIKTFSVFDNSILYLTDKFELFHNDLFVGSNVLETGYCQFEGHVIYLSDSHTYIGNDILENLSYVSKSEESKTSTIVLSGDFKLNYPNFTNNYYLYNIGNKSKSLICEFKNLYYFHRYKDVILLSDKVSLCAYFILSDENCIWQYNLTQLGEYEVVRTNEIKAYELLKFIGVWQDELLVACTDGLILSLNIHTGEERRRFHLCPEYPLGSIIRKKFHDANAFVLDGSKNILIALNSYFYMEIDLNTNTVKIIDIRENMAEVNIDFLRQSRDYAWDDNYIYSIGYVANHTSGIAKGDRCILAFNRHTYKIDWKYIFEDDSINTDIPQLAGNKLYQLTANKVLHIFEKTEV